MDMDPRKRVHLNASAIGAGINLGQIRNVCQDRIKSIFTNYCALGSNVYFNKEGKERKISSTN